MRKVKVLFFTADPSLGRPGGVPLELAEDLRQIKRHVAQARFRKHLIFEPHGAARADDLIDFLESTDALVVHFSGHGGNAGLVLVGRGGYEPHPVNAAALGQLFRTYHGPVRLAVLSACSSRPEAQAIANVVGCAIGTSSNISDDAAITFNSRFYQGIANGHSVQRAFDKARTALQVHNVPESEYPVLVYRKDVDPADLVLLKAHRLVHRRVAVATVTCVLTAAAVNWDTAVPHELTASDIACGSDSGVPSIRTLTGQSAATTSPADLSGPAADLADGRAFYQARKYVQAARAFEQAATDGNGEAMGCLGYMHLVGRGMEPQPATGFRLVHEAATQQRDPHAMYALAMAYLNGVGTGRREHLAKDWLEKAAEEGFAEAMRSLGSLVQEEKNDSSYRQALDWYRKAVDAGAVNARVDVGRMYELGLAVPRDSAIALRWYRSAAAAGSSRGMFAVGQSYEKGVGVPLDYKQARIWYLRAAKWGSADAMNSIGFLYHQGLGVRRSRGKAIRWYERAAQAGSPLAQGNLAALGRD